MFSMLFAIFLALTMKNNRLLSKVKYELLLICMTAPIMRILIPMEVLPWTKNINISYGLPQVVIFFNRTVFTLGTRAVSLWELILIILLSTSTINMLIIAGVYVGFLRERAKLPEATDPEIYRLLEKILKEKGKKRSIKVRWTEENITPFIFGIIKPTIMLPKLKFNEVELECILRHEIAHCLHGDLIMRFLWLLIKSFCYWNPAVYLLDKQFERVLEIRADEHATKGKSIAFQKNYMETIVKLSTQEWYKKYSFPMTFFNDNILTPRKRIEIIQYRNKRKRVDFIGANLSVSIPIILLAVAMNCLIFEPKGKIPDISEVGNVETVQDVTANNSFFIRNAEGTYDMYVDGIYRTTLSDTRGSDLKVYEAVEEALKYEEIK